jgi:hypothetical protein
MEAGLIALVSGLGGVAITAVAAYFGPLRLQRKKAEADLRLQREKAEADLRLQRERAEAELALELHKQRAAKEDAKENATAKDLETLINKIVELRVATALALEPYKEMVHDLKVGRRVDFDAFRAESSKRTARVHDASAGLLEARIFLSAGGYDQAPVSPSKLLEADARFLDCLDHVSSTVSFVVERFGPPPITHLGSMFTGSLDHGMEAAVEARRDLLQGLVQQVEVRYGVQLTSLKFAETVTRPPGHLYLGKAVDLVGRLLRDFRKRSS